MSNTETVNIITNNNSANIKITFNGILQRFQHDFICTKDS